MRGRITSFIKHYWISLWLVLASVAMLSSMIGFASYTKSSTAKSVVARMEEYGKLFSSNELLRGDSMLSIPVYVEENATTLTEYVQICNYAQGSPGTPYLRSINYELELKLVYKDTNGDFITFENGTAIGDRYIKVTVNNGTPIYFGKNGNNGYENLEAKTIELSLVGGQPLSDSIVVEYSYNQLALLSEPNPDYPKMYLEVTATPAPARTYLDLDPLKGRLDLQLVGSVKTIDWNGYINEVGARDANNTDVAIPSTLDDYNYVIEGVGDGTITLEWDSSKLALNQNFISELQTQTVTFDEGTENERTVSRVITSSSGKLEFYVDSNDTSRYDTQFYRVNSDLSQYETWGQVNGYIIKCKFTKTPTEESGT